MGQQRNLFIVALLLVSSTLECQAKVYQTTQDFLKAPDLDAYDFIVIGGGVGGSVVASRVSENPNTRVLLVEAGQDHEGVLNLTAPGLFPQINASQFNWNYQTVPQAGLDNRTIVYSRGKVLGGSSSINAMIFTRGSRHDYDFWGKVSGSPRLWSWAALWPWMTKYEKWTVPSGGRDIRGEFDPRAHGFKGQLQTSLSSGAPTELDRLALNAAGELRGFGYGYNLEPNDGNALGLTWAQWTIGNGERSSAATAYLSKDVRSRRNLDIVLNTLATRVLPVGYKKAPLEIRRVELRSTGGGSAVSLTARKELVLAAGTIGTPHLLLNSGIGDQEGLSAVGVEPLHNLRNVGRGMSEHVSVLLTWTRSVNGSVVDPLEALAEWKANRTGPLSEAVPAHQIIFKRFAEESPVFNTYPDPATGPTSPHVEIVILPSGGNINARIVLLTPRSRGSVKLRSSNPVDPPLIDLGFYTHPFDTAAMKQAIRDTKRFFDASPFTSNLTSTGQPYITGFLGPDPDALSDEEFDSRLREISNPYWHVVGTASMDKAHGVVDSELRVKGVKGLRIFDASVIPYVPTAHTQAAVYSLAERAVKLILDAR